MITGIAGTILSTQLKVKEFGIKAVNLDRMTNPGVSCQRNEEKQLKFWGNWEISVLYSHFFFPTSRSSNQPSSIPLSHHFPSLPMSSNAYSTIHNHDWILNHVVDIAKEIKETYKHTTVPVWFRERLDVQIHPWIKEFCMMNAKSSNKFISKAFSSCMDVLRSREQKHPSGTSPNRTIDGKTVFSVKSQLRKNIAQLESYIVNQQYRSARDLLMSMRRQTVTEDILKELNALPHLQLFYDSCSDEKTKQSINQTIQKWQSVMSKGSVIEAVNTDFFTLLPNESLLLHLTKRDPPANPSSAHGKESQGDSAHSDNKKRSAPSSPHPKEQSSRKRSHPSTQSTQSTQSRPTSILTPQEVASDQKATASSERIRNNSNCKTGKMSNKVVTPHCCWITFQGSSSEEDPCPHADQLQSSPSIVIHGCEEGDRMEDIIRKVMRIPGN